MKAAVVGLGVALALAGGGCGSSCDEPGEITFYWRFVGAQVAGESFTAGRFDVDDPATVEDEAGCATAAIEEIRITAGGTTETVPCTAINGVPGVVLPGFLRGDHAWRVDAYRLGQVAFTASGEAGARDCGNTVVDVDLHAVTPNELLVYYDFNGATPPGCASLGEQIAGIAFELRNERNQTVRTTGFVDGQGRTSHEVVPCQSPFAVVVDALPVGSYSFPYFTALNPAQLPVLQACDIPVRHDGFPMLVNLTPFAQACPVAPASPLAPPVSGPR